MVSWGPDLVFVCLFNQGFEYLRLLDDSKPNVEMHLGIIGFNLLHSASCVRVCFSFEHTFLASIREPNVKVTIYSILGNIPLNNLSIQWAQTWRPITNIH
jgi:hypothetical protein